MPSLGLGLGLQRYRKIGSVGGLLNQFSGAKAAYSTQLLNVNHSVTDSVTSSVTNGQTDAYVMTVRRSNDNARQSFTALEVANGTLSTFTGANDGFVMAWYDQSGNGFHLIPPSTTEEPQIVSSGTVIANGVLFDGTNDYLECASPAFNLTQPFTSFSVSRSAKTGLSDGYGVWSVANNASSTFAATSFYRDDDGLAINSGTTLTTAPGFTFSADTDYLKSSFFNTTSSETFVNGTSRATGTAGTTNPVDTLLVGMFYSGSRLILDGNIKELIIYDSDQSSNRVGIESNINSRYSVY